MRVTSLSRLRTLTAVASLLGLAACSSEPTGELIDDIQGVGGFQAGIATYVRRDGAGHCGYDASPNDMDIAAMNTPQFADSAVCGACAEVEGPQGTVRVRIVDSCPECQPAIWISAGRPSRRSPPSMAGG